MRFHIISFPGPSNVQWPSEGFLHVVSDLFGIANLFFFIVFRVPNNVVEHRHVDNSIQVECFCFVNHSESS